MPPARVPPALCSGPFNSQQAQAAGLTYSALRSRPWRQLLAGVWVHVDVDDSREMRLAAARLVLPPHGVLCGLTAAWIHGADVRHAEDFDVHVGFAKGRRVRPRPGIRVCQETLDAADYMAVDGVLVTTPIRTAFDCLRWLRGDERLVVADALTHLELVTVRELRAYFAGKKRLRNLRRGEALLDDVEPLTESPMESRMRGRLLAAGLPRPKAQVVVRAASGVFVARVDLAYPESKLAIEYDGAWHWKQRRQDERRWAALRSVGWEVLVFDADDVYRAADRMAAEVARALRRRAA